VTFAIATDAFNQIRQYSTSDVAVTIRLLEAIAVIATYTRNNKDRAALLRHADMIKRGSQEGGVGGVGSKGVEEHYQAAVRGHYSNETRTVT